MKELLDQPELQAPTSTKFRKWAFRLFLYFIVSVSALFYFIYSTINSVSEGILIDYEALDRGILIIRSISLICLLAGIVFTGLSHYHKEPKNYQFYVALGGFLSVLLFFAIAFYFVFRSGFYGVICFTI